MSAAFYQPRHAATLEQRRARPTAPPDKADDDDVVRVPGIAAMFRRHPARTRRAVLAAVGVVVSLLVASSVASASVHSPSAGIPQLAKVGPAAGRAVAKPQRMPAATVAAAPAAQTVASPAASIVHARTKAPAGQAVITGLAANGIPNLALNAYRVAADRMAHVQPSCGIDWALLAGIGREESDHGRFGGARLNPDGTSTPPIIGPALNGVGNQLIAAPADGMALDGDARYTHALGPMQFIPQTWAAYGADANGDGKADIFNINDAALGAARYLCANGGNLRTAAGQVRAILAYNHSDQYLAQVLALSDAYRLGVPVKGIPVGNITGPLPPITATTPYAVNPGAPTAVRGTSAGAGHASAASPARSGTKSGTKSGTRSGTTSGTKSGTKSPTTSGTRTKPGTRSGSPGRAGAGSGSGSTSPAPTAPAPTPAPAPPPTVPTQLPTTLPKPPVPSTSPTAGASPTCRLGLAGTCVVH